MSALRITVHFGGRVDEHDSDFANLGYSNWHHHAAAEMFSLAHQTIGIRGTAPLGGGSSGEWRRRLQHAMQGFIYPPHKGE